MHDITVGVIKCSVYCDRIAPLNSKREPDDWRYKLKKGDVVDAMDRVG